MGKTCLVDLIREVPETAVRLYLGAKVTERRDHVELELDGRTYTVSPETLDRSQRLSQILLIRPREIQYATDVLELRHAAENLFLEELAGVGSVPKVLFAPAAELLAAASYRAMIPSDVMSQSGKALANFTLKLDLAKALQYDILWVQLAAGSIVHSIAKRAQEEGMKIVYDVDDRFDSVPEDNPAAAIYVRDKVDEVWEMIELADVVTVSTEPLAEHVRSRAKEVRVIPNMIPAALWPRKAPKKNPGETRILWAGSPSHYADLKIVAPALKAVLARHQGKVKFICFGDQMPEMLSDVSAFVETMPFVSFDLYPQALVDAAADIAIAPLAQNEFNECRSAVKYYEYSACGYPSLLSPVGEYRHLEDDAPRMIVHDSEWEAALEKAIANGALLRDAAKISREWTLKNRCVIGSKAKPWMGVVETLLGKKEAVHAQ